MGRVISDQTGTTSVNRVYWSNNNTRILEGFALGKRGCQPNFWGQFTFGE